MRAVAEYELCVPSNEYTFPFVILAGSNCIKMGLVRFEVSLTHFMPTHNSTVDCFIDCHSGAGCMCFMLSFIIVLQLFSFSFLCHL